jgi:hypothetical protein
VQPLTQSVQSIPGNASITAALPVTTGPPGPSPTVLVRSLQSSMRSQPLTQSPLVHSPRLQPDFFRRDYASKTGGSQYE